MASLSSLRDLAACWSIIHGKALSFEDVGGSGAPVNGRPDFIDAKTEQMRSALSALKDLERLAEIDKRYAQVMFCVHVVWGEVARTLKENWVDLGAELREHKPKKRHGIAYHGALREALYSEAIHIYYRAKQAWEKLT